MAKFGKKYRNFQINEWSSNYIDYKRLKQKIKSIKAKIDEDIRNGTLISDINISIMPSLEVIPIEKRKENLNLNDFSILYTRKYGKELEQFIEILNEELNKYYSFYKILENELYQKVNNHLYTQTNYLNYNLFDIYNEMHKLNKTVFLIKCLNSFSYDNLTALKNILKKFDNKLGIYCGKIEYKYIIYQLTLKQDNKLKYLLESKILDETLTICESNLKELFKYYSQNQNKLEYFSLNLINKDKQNNDIDTNLIDDNGEKNDLNLNNSLPPDLNQNNVRIKIVQIKQEILENVKDTEKLSYFKIQYGDWFYFLEENECPIKQREKFLENSIFNPILSSTYKNDNIISKFISNKECLNEAEKSQNQISINNMINIIFIFIHTFFYNTLITCIYPLLFIYIKGKNFEHIYAFITIALTYFMSSFFMIIYHNSKIEDIKMINALSYIFCIIGSLCYIFSILYIDSIDNDYIVFGFVLCSRIFIGLGNNIMVGKKYITLYTPRFFTARICLTYLIFQILGLAFGPFIGIGLLYIPDFEFWKLKYNCYNCIGWYGTIFSIFLFLLNIIFFTRPENNSLPSIKNQYYSIKPSTFNGDLEDTMDQEFYKRKQELINNNIDNNTEDNFDDNLIIDNNTIEDFGSMKRKSSREFLNYYKQFTLIGSQKNVRNLVDIGSLDSSRKLQRDNLKTRTISDNENDLNLIVLDLNKNTVTANNPLPITVQKEIEPNQNNSIDADFNKVNMIPRTLDDIIRKEKRTFGYINHNILMLYLLLFFNNMIKENYIAFVSYFITINESFSKNGKEDTEVGNLDFDKVKLTCLLTGGAYLAELISLFFIFPFYKINVLFKKYAIILMTLTIILMFILSIFIYIEINSPYFIIIAFLIFINMTLEVISSSYLTYLLPPGWKFKNIRAGALTVYIMTFGKICGILFCLISYDDSNVNYFGITVVVTISYTAMIIYLCKSTNLRIKAICRIIQIKKLEELIL